MSDTEINGNGAEVEAAGNGATVEPLAVGNVPSVAADQPIASSWGNLVAEDINALLVVANFFTSGAVNNGTATSMTTFVTQNAVGSLPFAYTMLVAVTGVIGGNGAANSAFFSVLDEAGAAINYKNSILGAEWIFDQANASKNRSVSLLGKKDYAAGATCGFRLAYRVSASNIYADLGIQVSLMKR